MANFMTFLTLKPSVEEESTSYFCIFSEHDNTLLPIAKIQNNEEGVYTINSVVPGSYPSKCKSLDEALKKACYVYNIGNLVQVDENFYTGLVEVLIEEKDKEINVYQKFNNQLIFLLGTIQVDKTCFIAKSVLKNVEQNFLVLNQAFEFVLNNAGISVVEEEEDEQDEDEFSEDEDTVDQDSRFYPAINKTVH